MQDNTSFIHIFRAVSQTYRDPWKDCVIDPKMAARK